MSRLSRAQLQEHNRARVLAAARDEFAERGFRDAKIDRIAERAELTRGGVYSNFPGKRALYFAVLAEAAEHAPVPAHPQRGHTVRDALGAFARAWVARLPLATGEPSGTARLDVDLLPEVLADVRTRRAFTQLMKLDAILLGLALERLRPPGTPPQPSPGAPTTRLIRMAELILTTLHGASQLAAAAPGFSEPFDVVSACEQLAGLGLNDWWAPPAIVPSVQQANDPWSPPPVMDVVRGEPAQLTGDGVVAILGLHRLAAVEQAVRTAPPGAEVTGVLVTSAPDELAPLARLVITELCGCLRQAVAPAAWPRLRIVCDESGALAAAAGVPAVSDETEAAVSIQAGRIIARADGRGACHTVSTEWTDAARRDRA